MGFYSLSSFTLTIEELPEQVGRKLPRHDSIPAALIGRLARDVRSRGKGLGELMLADAIKRALSAGTSLALYAIVVDAKDERAAEFYRSFDFQSLPSRPNRLFLPTSTALAAIGKTITTERIAGSNPGTAYNSFQHVSHRDQRCDLQAESAHKNRFDLWG